LIKIFIKEQLRKRDTLWIIRIINRDRGICHTSVMARGSGAYGALSL
jgi:hypothetical protein